MKKKRIRIAVIMTTISVVALLSILVCTGFISFLFNGFDYIDNNEERYVINSTVLS